MMERLTKRTDNGDAWYNHRLDKTVYDDDLLQRLAYYEDMEEQGRLVVLPYKVGDTVYRIYRFKRGKNWKKEAEFIRTVQLTRNNLFRIVLGGEFGKTVFLTREEAEQALRKGVENGKAV